MPKTYKLLEVQNLNTSFKIDAGRVLAVNGVSFNLEKGKILGIVGESGSGKSVSAYSIMGILDKNGHVDSGKIIYKGTDLLRISEKEMREIRGNKISIIFQDAMSSLNPTWSIGNQLREAILTHSKDPIKEATYSYENEVTSDKQRIQSMEKGIKHHPDNQELRDDLNFVRNKLIEDEKKLIEVKAKAKDDLKKKEKEKKEEFNKNKGVYNEKIKLARRNVFKNYFKLNEVPPFEEISSQKKHKELTSASYQALGSYKDAKRELKEFKKTKPVKQKGEFKKYIVELYRYLLRKHRLNKQLHYAKKFYKKEKRSLKWYEFKFKWNYTHKPRHDRWQAYKQAKIEKKNYYWELISTYRETKYSANKKALQMLIEVGITEPEKRMKQYPFELSGGMLQRCMIAMALVQKPDILIADEPTTALDVTIQAQILELLKKLQKEYGMAIMIITHDLGVVAQICDEVDIMYAGRIVERGNVDDIFYNPQHEYTKGLLKSMPKINQPKGLLDPIKGNPVDLFCLPKGCAFSSRCKLCMQICIDKYPEEVELKNGHCASCWAMVKRMHEAKVIDVKGKPTGKPLIYNGAVISNFKTKNKKEVVKNA